MDYLTTEVLSQRSGLYMLGSQGPRGSSSSGQHLMAGTSDMGEINPPQTWPHIYNRPYSDSEKSRSSSSGSIRGENQQMLSAADLAGVHYFSQRFQPSSLYDKRFEPPPLHDPNWHIPRASLLLCRHKDLHCSDHQKCIKCQQNSDDNSSLCSSISPPPTFTALDKYAPVRPRSKCSCSLIFVITTIFSLLVLLIIFGFIIYIEMVLKHQTEMNPNRRIM